LVNGTDTATDLSFTDNEPVDTYALTYESMSTGSIANVYDITSQGLGLQRTFKTEKTSADDYRINTTATSGKPINIKSIQLDDGGVNQKDFIIGSNKVSRIRVYVWLEGQDVDCINLASQGGGIELDLGLTKDDEIGNVLVNQEVAFNIEYEMTGSNQVKVTARADKEIELPDNTWSYETITNAQTNLYGDLCVARDRKNSVQP
jgi:hypothetical protein